MSSHTVARRYAAALADVAVAQGEQREIQDELVGWELMIQSNSQLREVFENPTISYTQKQSVLKELISRTKVRPSTANFLQTLLKNQRITALGEINKLFARVLDERAGVVAALVTTARPISEDIKKALSNRLTSITGKQVRLSFATDEQLIGGMVARVGSTVYDGSILNQLRRMEQALAGR
ncbi:MAG: ATP synthase F1 subunit delta [bacterium]